MCSEQFRGAAFLLKCSCTIPEPFWSLQPALRWALQWVNNSRGLAPPLHPPSLAPELHTVVQSHHLWLGCCFLCLLSGIARLLLSSAVPSAGRGSFPRPSLACPLECCEAAAVSALLLQALLACWDRSAFYCSTTPLLKAKNMMGNILNI